MDGGMDHMNHTMGGDMNHTMGGGMNSTMGGGMMGRRMHYMHMTFFWGSKAEILFDGWPGASGGMYALALVLVFFLAALLEWFSHCRVIDQRTGPVAAGLVRTAMHAVRMGLAYLVMLAVMSFNGGVLIVAVAGHAAGYLLFAAVPSFKRTPLSPDGVDGKGADLPPMVC